MKPDLDAGQSIQRVKVGMTGLAIVLLLIGLASAILRSVHHDRPMAAPGASKPEVIANLALTNDADPAGEPLAEIGVAPTGQGNASAAATTGAAARR